MELLYKYQNGNCAATIYDDGTREIEWEGEKRPEYPFNLDCKITNYCNNYHCMAHCFVGDSKVATKFGEVSISHIKIGDIVKSYDFKNNKTEDQKVYQIFKRDIEEDIFEIMLESGESIECTKNHEFFCSRGWVKAENLNLLDILHKI